MSDYLGNLAARNLEPAAAVRPRLASRFEPVPSAAPQFQAEPAFFEQTVEETAEPPRASVFSPYPRRGGQRVRPRSEGRSEAEDTPKGAPESRAPEPVRPVMTVGPLAVVDSGRSLTRGVLPSEASPPGPLSRGERGKQEAVTPVILPVWQEFRAVEVPEVRAAHPTAGFDTPSPLSLRERGLGGEDSERRAPENHHSLNREPVVSTLQPRITVAEPDPFPVRREAPAPEPVIHVSIGRIEVRATQTPKAPVRERSAARPAVDLEDYLRQRSKGEGR
jgi:hypothetical protein